MGFSALADGEPSAVDALAGFQRFPGWMWRNADVVLFLSWLRAHNGVALAATAPSLDAAAAAAASLPLRAAAAPLPLRAAAAPLPLRAAALSGCGVYGLDLYALFSSIRVVLRYLAGVDKDAHAAASRLYAAFDACGGDSQRYGADAALGVAASCKAEAEGVLRLLQERLSAATRRCLEPEGETSLEAKRAALRDADALAGAVENARLVVNAEAYYTSMFAGRGAQSSSWNIRDTHMHEALGAVRAHLKLRAAFAAAIAAQERGVPAGHSQVAELAAEPPKVVVWAHNSHVGDARATEMGCQRGKLNIGQLVREEFGVVRACARGRAGERASGRARVYVSAAHRVSPKLRPPPPARRAPAAPSPSAS